jgi:hypothetical protein
MKKIAPYILIACLLSGCAISRKVNYTSVHANVPSFNQKISIATWDQRIQVLDGSRKPDFVGYMRSGAGIAYPIGTDDGRAFADILSSDIASALSSKGSSTNIVNTKFNETEPAILDELKKTNNDRLILINCKQFNTDGYGAEALIYELTVNIYSNQGDILQQKTFADKNQLGGNAFWGPGKYKQYMPEALKALIEKIFNDAEITSALKAP